MQLDFPATPSHLARGMANLRAGFRLCHPRPKFDSQNPSKIGRWAASVSHQRAVSGHRPGRQPRIWILEIKSSALIKIWSKNALGLTYFESWGVPSLKNILKIFIKFQTFLNLCFEQSWVSFECQTKAKRKQKKKIQKLQIRKSSIFFCTFGAKNGLKTMIFQRKISRVLWFFEILQNKQTTNREKNKKESTARSQQWALFRGERLPWFGLFFLWPTLTSILNAQCCCGTTPWGASFSGFVCPFHKAPNTAPKEATAPGWTLQSQITDLKNGQSINHKWAEIKKSRIKHKQQKRRWMRKTRKRNATPFGMVGEPLRTH